MDLTTLIIFICYFLPLTSNSLCRILSAGCPTSTCGNSVNSVIRFPFRIKASEQPEFCGYPGFDVSCDIGSKYTLIEIPNSGKFWVKKIDYAAQEIWVNDPHNCLPKRLLTLNLSGSPFVGVYHQDLSFFNCSTLVVENGVLDSGHIGPIPCLSGSYYSVFAVHGNGNVTSTLMLSSKCSPVVLGVKVPVQRLQWTFSASVLSEDLRLKWFMPCELKGRAEGEGSRKAMEIAPIICMLGLLWLWARSSYGSIIRPSFIALLGRAGQLPLFVFNLQTGPNSRPIIVSIEIQEVGPGPMEENSCAICMAEYRPKDKTGILPMCRHYFHANCITKWLISCNDNMIRKTCPICRAPVNS